VRSLVLYATRHGNTHRVAEAVAVALGRYGPAETRRIGERGLTPADAVPADVDLLVIGGPTEAHGATPEVAAFIEQLPAGALMDVMTAAFDTRLNWPHWASGSAGEAIAQLLEAADATVLRPLGSFLVTMEPDLRNGELARASDWALELGERAAATVIRRHAMVQAGATTR
jgi:flavodoxin